MTKSIGPWLQHSRDTVYENPWLRLEHHSVTTPGKTDGIYGKVCFKNTAVGVVPLDDDGYTYLVGQHRYPLDSYSWEIPEGGAPLGTSPADTARRELAEETGLRCAALYHYAQLHTSNSCTDEVADVFLALELTPGETAPEETEDLQVRRLPLGEAVEMAMCGEITDALSVAALLKLRLLLDRHRGDLQSVIAAMKSCPD